MSSKHQRSLIKNQLVNYNLFGQLAMTMNILFFLEGKELKKKSLVTFKKIYLIKKIRPILT